MDMDEALQTFLVECRELLQDMESALLAIETTEDKSDLVNAIFRAAHTIKGSSGLFRLDHIVAFTHVLESVLDQVRAGKLVIADAMVGLLLSCCDHIGALVGAVAEGHTEPDPALSERVTVSRHGAWLDEPDTIAIRRRALLRLIGYRVINRRFQSLARRTDPPFRAAAVGTGTVFHIGRTTNLVIDSRDGAWRKGLVAAAATLRQALAQGFTRAEIDEQLATLR